MSRGLDHIVWPARDLDALAGTFRRLGFTVGRRNRHPWGTVNHIIQFDGCFLELLGFAEDYHPLPAEDPAEPFAGFCAAFLRRSAGGAAMLVLRSDDAMADARAFAARGLGQGRTLPFERAAQGPDGRDRTVSFTVAFADLPGLAEVGAFVCEQHRPENFWDAAAQRHPNGALGIAEVAITTHDPPAAERAMLAFAGHDRARPARNGFTIPLGNGTLAVSRAPAALPSAPVPPSRIAAVRIPVGDLPRVSLMLDEAGLRFQTGEAGLTVGAHEAGGTDLVFCAVPAG